MTVLDDEVAASGAAAIRTVPGADEGAPAGARIGPNAVLQLVPVLEARFAADEVAALFESADCVGWLSAPPAEMVDERPVARLHQALRRRHPTDAPALAAAAGRGTGAYILAHRIPKPAQSVLKALPAPLASRMLLSAIARHAWTFAGSGRFAATPGRPAIVEIADNPVVAGEHAAGPVCHWHAGVFETLFRTLVHPRSRARETACCAAGAPACRFEIDWRRP